MQKLSGIIQKLDTQLDQPVHYFFSSLLEKRSVFLNDCLGKSIRLAFSGNIYCVQCRRKIRKTWQQGYCYPCYQRLCECNLCVIHPERCRYYEGHCRADDWAHHHCGQPHAVYLANSSHLKIGITRAQNIPSRWIDQGAAQGLVIMQTANRYQAGLVEVACKRYLADKTSWQKMLKTDPPPLDLYQERTRLLQNIAVDLDLIDSQLSQLQKNLPNPEKNDPGIHVLNDNTMTQITYPILQYPQSISALHLERQPIIEGTLLGIKAQYLILDTGVISIRKFAGYELLT